MSKTFKCKVCSKKFSEKSYLTSHMPSHSTDTPFPCTQCHYRGKTKKYLARHMKQTHREKAREHKCTVCGKLFLHQSGLKVHAMVHSGVKPHECSVCGKSFRVTYSLNSHMLIHKNEKPFACSFCEYACRDSSSLRKHQNKHMGLEKAYQCKICRKDYKSRAALKMHIAETHLDLDVRKFQCQHCDKMFKTNAHRSVHIEAIHKRSLVCNCPICGRRILNKNNLSAHMRTHLNERPFSCTHPGCNTSFKDKNSLTKHSFIHNPDQHFPCSYCGRKFARKSHMKEHERVMHVERKRCYECDCCGSRFYSKNYLIKHIQTKHVYKEQFKYECDKCGLVTHNKPSIVMHLKYGHSNDQDLQCKICDSKVYKRHMYLKQHYRKTHNIRYKITKKGYNTRSRKERKTSVEIKVEPVDTYEEIELMDVQKQEDEEVNDSLVYSKSVLSEDIAASVLREGAQGSEVDFDEFFIRHVFAKKEDKTEDKNSDGIDKEKEEYVKRRIKQILIRTEKIQKAKAERRKKETEERERIEREKEEAIARAKRETEELEELRRVRVMYNRRMEEALMKEKETKEHVKIKYFKKATENSNNIKENITTDKGTIETENENNYDLKINCTENIEKLVDIANDTDDNYRKETNDKINIEVKDNLVKSDIENDRNDSSVINKNVGNEISENENSIHEITLDNEIHDDNDRNNIKSIKDDKYPSINKNHETDIKIHSRETELTKQSLSDNIESIGDNYDTNDKNNAIITPNYENELNNKTNENELNQEIPVIQEEYEESSNGNPETSNFDGNNQKFKEIGSIEEPFDNELKANINKDTNDIKDIENESSDDDTPLLTRRRKCTMKEEARVNKKGKKIEFNTFQCYICFKLYQTKQELSTHCQEHFDICHSRTLTKCHLCEHVSYKGLAQHMRTKHDIEISTLRNTIRGDNNASGYSYDINGAIIEVIPSAQALNKNASDALDKNRRLENDRTITKSKLVRKGKEWVVEKVLLPIQYDSIPDLSDRELSKLKVTDNDVERLGQLSYLVKEMGLKMMFPCFKCSKICQSFPALKLHQRRHEENPKPFKPRLKNKNKTNKVKLDKTNRFAMPKPIINKHKCDRKLREFFEREIRGGDIEFWQFLKIYNKMDREQVKDFSDLEARSDFGNHFDYYKDESSD